MHLPKPRPKPDPRFSIVAAYALIAFVAPLTRGEQLAEGELPPALAAEIDENVREVLDQTQFPSASIAVVRDGKMAYVKAYGQARLAPDEIKATNETRYGIGSVSKQFVAAAVLLLAEDGKLKLDDPVGQYIPKLTAGDKITLRQVLNHTSGYRDYWPQDYVFPAMLKPVTPVQILDQWARVPLDFQPGDDWQYSNTGYTVAGQIVEKVSGKALMEFMQKRIFEPLKMTRADEHDTKPLAAPDAAGYMRVALGPVRPAPKEGAGWLYAAGPLAMPARDLALWNISLIQQSLLQPESYTEMTRSVRVGRSQRDAEYGLGLDISKDDSGRRMLRHGGGVSGFLTENRVWPEVRVAISVIVNCEGASAHRAIADRLQEILLPATGHVAEARAMFVALQRGEIDPARMSENGRSYFTPEALRDAAQGLRPLGPVRMFVSQSREERGGMTYRSYRATCARGEVLVSARVLPDGKYEQFMVSAALR